MHVSVVIPTYKSPSSLSKLLSTLANEEEAVDRLQVICVNNIVEHYDGSLKNQWSSSFYDFIYVNSDHIGVNHARNKGIELATGDILWFLDDDCSLQPEHHTLKKLTDYHSDHEDLAGIGGYYLNDGSLTRRSLEYFLIADEWFRSCIKDDGQSQTLLGGNCSYKSDLFKKGYRFKSDIRYGGAETMFNHDLIQAGYQLKVFPDLSVYHHIHLRLWSFIYKAYLQGVGKKKNGLDIHQNVNRATKNEKLSLYKVFFKIGYFSRLTFKEKMTLLGEETKIYYHLKDIYYFFSSPVKSLYHYSYKQLHRFMWFILNILYWMRNTLAIPVVKTYFVLKYHYDQYLTPFITKLFSSLKHLR